MEGERSESFSQSNNVRNDTLFEEMILYDAFTFEKESTQRPSLSNRENNACKGRF